MYQDTSKNSQYGRRYQTNKITLQLCITLKKLIFTMMDHMYKYKYNAI